MEGTGWVRLDRPMTGSGALARPASTAAQPRSRADEEREALRLFTGDGADVLLRAVVEAEGAELVRHVRHQVQHRPGVGVSAGWKVTWRRGDLEGEDYILATTAKVRGGPLQTRAQLDGTDVSVWRHPADPSLPGLSLATDAVRVERLLGEPLVRLELLTYRPLRRAVLRAEGVTRTIYLKVVRPHTAKGLHGRHEVMRGAGLPVAASRLLGDGVLLLDALPGAPLTDLLAADGAATIHPGLVESLLNRFPRELLDLPRRTSWSERIHQHAEAAVAVLPEDAERIMNLADRVAHVVHHGDAGPIVPTHGDLHEANLLMRDGAVVGLLDVDTAGPGHRVDDLGCLLGHLSVLPALAPEVHHHVPSALPLWLIELARGVDIEALRARAAGVALSLVAGAGHGSGDWRADAEGRLAAAENWFDRSTAHESRLIDDLVASYEVLKS